MGILHTLGLEDRKIISQGRETAGTVTRVKTCWWIKVNTKHVRMGPLDGAKFPTSSISPTALAALPTRGAGMYGIF